MLSLFECQTITALHQLPVFSEKQLFNDVVRDSKVKEPKNDALRMLGNDRNAVTPNPTT